jgi:hypothetical protein
MIGQRLRAWHKLRSSNAALGLFKADNFDEHHNLTADSHTAKQRNSKSGNYYNFIVSIKTAVWEYICHFGSIGSLLPART